jgi:hypothetical protein
MLSFPSQNWKFSIKRLVFEQKPPEIKDLPQSQPSSSELPDLDSHNKKALLEIQNRARQVKREVQKQETIENARTRGEIKSELQGLKIPNSFETRSDGQLQQSFTFGDQNLPGKLIYPANADSSKPTSFVFTFSGNPDQQDISEMQQILNGNSEKIGNTVIVQIQNPGSRPIEINGKSVNLLGSLVEDLKKYQNLPELSKLQEVNNVLTIADSASSAEISKILEEYLELSKKNNLPKAFSEIILPAELSQKIADMKSRDSFDEAAEVINEGDVKKVILKASYGPKKNKNIFSGGQSPLSETSSANSENSSSDSPLNVPQILNDLVGNNQANSKEIVGNFAGISESSDSKEKEPIKGYVGFFGDSNLEAFANPKRFLNLPDGGKGYAIRGHNTRQLMSQQMGIDPDGNPKPGNDKIPDLDKMEKVVINCGLNDVFSNLTTQEITKNLKTIVNYFLKKGKKVYLTTLSPFGNYKSQYMSLDTQRHGQSLEDRRSTVNNFILSELKNLPGLRIIPLHLSKNEGGVASGQKDQYGNDTVDSTFNSGDNLHFKPAEFSKLLSRYLKEKTTSDSSTPSSNPSTSPNQPTPYKLTGQDKYWSENVYGAPKGFSGGSISQAAAIRSREILNQGGMKAGEYKEETINGVTYAFMHEGHPRSPSDHSSWHPSISVYVKKDQKKPPQDKPESKST